MRAGVSDLCVEGAGPITKEKTGSVNHQAAPAIRLNSTSLLIAQSQTPENRSQCTRIQCLEMNNKRVNVCRLLVQSSEILTLNH